MKFVIAKKQFSGDIYAGQNGELLTFDTHAEAANFIEHEVSDFVNSGTVLDKIEIEPVNEDELEILMKTAVRMLL